MTQRSEELGFGLMDADSANSDRISGDGHNNDTTVPLPVVSVSPFPHWNTNETSQYYSEEPAGGNLTIDSSRFRTSQNFQMDSNHSYEGEHKSHTCRPDSGFPCPEGHVGWPYQYTRHDNLTIPDDMMNAAFNLNSFETASESWPQMVNPIGMGTSGYIGQPMLNMNLGMTLSNPNQGGAESLLTPGKLDERFMTVGSGSNRESKSTTIMPNVDVTGNSLPPITTYHNQLGSQTCLNPGDLEFLFNSRPGLHSGPPNAFQMPAAGDQNRYLRQVNRNVGPGGGKAVGVEFADVGNKNCFERCKVLSSFPFVASQTTPHDSRQGRGKEQLVPSSIGMVTYQPPFKLIPENNGKFSSRSFANPPLVMATRSTRAQDPSSNHGQSQVVGSIQQSNSPLGRHSFSDQGIQTGKGDMTALVSRPSIMSSLKRAASQPLPSPVQDQRRKIPPTQHFIHPSISTWTGLAPSVPNTPQAIPPLVHTSQSLTPQATQSFVPPLFPPTWIKSAPSAPNSSQTIPPLMPQASFVPPVDKRISSSLPPSHTIPTLMPTEPFVPLIDKRISSSLTPSHTIPPLMPPAPLVPPIDKRISSSLPPSRTTPLPNQLIAQSLARQRLRSPIIPSAPNSARGYSKYKDQTPEPIGYKCLLCKRDLSYAPEGPISQPPARPAAAVLPCGHTFHDHCLKRITPDEQSKDPPCIPCALRE